MGDTYTAVVVLKPGWTQDDLQRLIEGVPAVETVAFLGPEVLVELPRCERCGADECRSM